jgi:DNA-binding transcriptional LysR family regulator
VLLVGKDSPLKSAEELWKRDKIDESLICLPANESLTKDFLAHLMEMDLDWFPSVEASSMDLIETYVANGLGIGLGVAVPKRALPVNIRALPLKNFPPALIGAVWRDKKSTLVEAFLDMARKRARELM